MSSHRVVTVRSASRCRNECTTLCFDQDTWWETPQVCVPHLTHKSVADIVKWHDVPVLLVVTPALSSSHAALRAVQLHKLMSAPNTFRIVVLWFHSEQTMHARRSGFALHNLIVALRHNAGREFMSGIFVGAAVQTLVRSLICILPPGTDVTSTPLLFETDDESFDTCCFSSIILILPNAASRWFRYVEPLLFNSAQYVLHYYNADSLSLRHQFDRERVLLMGMVPYSYDARWERRWKNVNYAKPKPKPKPQSVYL